MRRSILGLGPLVAVAFALAGCGDQGAPAKPAASATPAVTAAAMSASATATAAPTAMVSAEPSAEAAPSASPSASASAEPVASASAAPSGSASASASAAKGFAFPSPKSGILTPADADKIVASGARARVRLLDAGKEPLEKVAYAPAKGDAVAIHLDLGSKIDLSAQGQPTPAILVPPQVLDVDVQTEEADEATGALVAMLLRKVTVRPEGQIDQASADQLSKQLENLKGYALRERVSSHGVGSELKVEVPASAPEGAEQLLTSLNAAFRAMIVALPEEPIGTGARWQVLSRDDSSTITSVVELDEYTLKDRSGTKLTVDVVARQLAASDKIKLPMGMPASVSTKLVKLSASSTGSLVIDTKQMGPVKGRSTYTMKVTMDASAPGRDKMTLDLNAKQTVVIGRRSGGAAASSAAVSAAPSASATATATAAPKGATP